MSGRVRRKKALAAAVATAACAAGLASCELVVGVGSLSERAVDGGAPVPDATAGDVGTKSDGSAAFDAGSDSEASIVDAAADGPILDAADAAEAGVVYTYSDITDTSAWLTFDISAVQGSGVGYVGGAFDGRFVYFAPQGYGPYTGHLLVFDTTKPYADAGSWTTFDLTGVDSNATGFHGAVFDGQYLYLVPEGHEIALQCDTHAFPGCSSSGAWSKFDTSAIQDAGVVYAGGLSDGRYTYLVPFSASGGAGLDVAIRFDRNASGGFGVASSWETFFVGSHYFSGGLFDSRYVHFVPGYLNEATMTFDTDGGFADPSSWSTFDLGIFDAGPKNWAGGAFDGQYLYLAPSQQGAAAAPSGDVFRCDSRADGGCNQATAWTHFDISTLALGDGGAGGFGSGAFDGRYVYFVPGENTLVVRVDTTAPPSHFTYPGVWSAFDVAGLTPRGFGMAGAVFDGEYIYFVPYYGAVVARFDARQPKGPPTSLGGSFY